MKRRVIIIGIIAIVCFIAYQFFFADHRSRLRVETDPVNDLRELSVLTQEAHFNESVRSRSVLLPEKPRTIERKVIKEAFIEFESGDVTATKRSLEALIKQFDGYISSNREDNYSGGPQYQSVVRIPSDKLDDFISKIDPLAKKMKSKNVSTQDITEEYIDLTERVVTKRELEKNYREILRKATKVSEMLEVEEQLEEVRGEIESMEGRIQYINSRVSYSTLTITYYQLITVNDEESFGTRIANSLASGWLSLLDFIVNILFAWPLLIVAPIIIWASLRWVRKRFSVLGSV
ncbi:MAG: DUF4349 domain-containing protein [Bacteroidota bacterium]